MLRIVITLRSSSSERSHISKISQWNKPNQGGVETSSQDLEILMKKWILLIKDEIYEVKNFYYLRRNLNF